MSFSRARATTFSLLKAKQSPRRRYVLKQSGCASSTAECLLNSMDKAMLVPKGQGSGKRDVFGANLLSPFNALRARRSPSFL
eukprot:1841612-Karenia_brevis.AAC.1